ncbi:MAG: D-alanyl-D-alanine carboxypeptidase family protein [Termitinemataceae bacterium]|nr:MAG: D-alanyl-D-alanine carboxypeptidase family protein [Termitinemataceae bacterium]
MTKNRCLHLRFLFSLLFACTFLAEIFAGDTNQKLNLDPFADAPTLTAISAVLMDASSGMVLYAKNSEMPIPPASLTKLMTIHVAMESAKKLDMPLTTPAKLPPESWAVNQPPRSSLMFLAEGQTVSLNELFLGLAIPSGNDAAVAVALNFSPTINGFAALMNLEAAKLGLRVTHFVEPSGISEENMTTAREFAEFCRVYIKLHPENLQNFHSVKEFIYPKAENVPESQKYDPKPYIQTNHIGILKTFNGVDGLKTGYIDESGYNIALTAKQNGTRFIAVVMGVPAAMGAYWGPRARDSDGRELLEWGYKNFKTIKPLIPEIPKTKVWKGKKNRAGLVIQNEHTNDAVDSFTVMADRGGGDLKWDMNLNELIAPVEKGEVAGKIICYDNEGELLNINLVSADDIERGGFFKRLFHSIALFFKRLKK